MRRAVDVGLAQFAYERSTTEKTSLVGLLVRLGCNVYSQPNTTRVFAHHTRDFKTHSNTERVVQSPRLRLEFDVQSEQQPGARSQRAADHIRYAGDRSIERRRTKSANQPGTSLLVSPITGRSVYTGLEAANGRQFVPVSQQTL